MNTTWSRFNVTSIVLGFAFLYLPIVLLVVFSFNESKLVTVWGGFSTKWYVSLFHNQGLMDATWVTARVGVISATVATVLGTLAALTLTRYTRFRGRVLFSGMVFAPLVMPEVITGLSLLLLFVAVGLDRGFLTVTLAHITLTMCFVAVVVQSRLVSFDRSLEEAAMDLGATPVKTFFQITLPVIMPAIVSGWMLAFTLVARRSGHRQLHLRARRHHAADEDLQPGSPRRDAGDQRRLHHPDRGRGDWRHHRLGRQQAA